MLEIDGSFGEGGGQILRTSLALAAITGKPIRISNIRARRKNPGLAAQHVACAKAAEMITEGSLVGATVGSSVLEFRPRRTLARSYILEIGTAGATSLLLHSVYMPLAMAGKESSLQLTGGTHVEWSPPFEFLEMQWTTLLARMGLHITVSIQKHGFYPKGGGAISAVISPVQGGVRPLILENRGAVKNVRVVSVAANLPSHVAERQGRRALERLRSVGIVAELDIKQVNAWSPGSCLTIFSEFENSSACYSTMGKKGKRAEEVADETCDRLIEFLRTNATVDEYTADQILLPLSLANGISKYTTPRVTQHLITNAEVIREFLDVNIEILGGEGKPGVVMIDNTHNRLPDKNR